MTFQEYKKQSYYNKDIKTEAHFEQLKGEFIKNSKKIEASMASGMATSKPGFLKSIPDGINKSMEILFWPVFMDEFNKHQSVATAASSIVKM